MATKNQNEKAGLMKMNSRLNIRYNRLMKSNDFPASMGTVAPRELTINGIKNLDEAANYSEKQLLAIHGVGPKAVRIIKDELAGQGKSLKTEPAAKHRIYSMTFGSTYPYYVAKAEKKNRTKQEVDELIRWLTGYSQNQLESQIQREVTFEEFFNQAPKLNPDRKLITGVVCGVKVEDIADPLMQEIRYLDKVVDELAKGKAMEKIIRK